MTLQSTDFPSFYRAVHKRDPFPWQSDLVDRVLSDGRWPELIDIPTGLGKTSIIDVSLFVTAATAGTAPATRLGRRRLFFVVDRRLVVDEAWNHALTVAQRLDDTDDAVTIQVRNALRGLSSSSQGSTLSVTRMRGGATWESAWVDRPDQPAIVVGTVDQVGSRLLFRGYGTSDRRKPIDAALAGVDSLIVVDEAHLATALTTTINAAHVRDAHGIPLPRANVVLMTATSGRSGADVFSLDVERHRSSPVAWQRLHAQKRLTLISSDATSALKVMADLAVRAVDSLAGPRVLLVCNTIDHARSVHSDLQKRLANLKDSLPVMLMIGRSRPADRDRLNQRVIDQFGIDIPRSAGRPVVLVATQTVEVGINLDADVLVTESTAWDSLVQRLGRLNRLGHLGSPDGVAGAARAVVVHDGVENGPVYGSARDVCWTSLCELASSPLTTIGGALDAAGVDVSPLACRALTTQMDPASSASRPEVPLLTRSVLDQWVQTGPIPLGDPPLEPYLHGFDQGSPSVSVLWRDGLFEPGAPDERLSEHRVSLLLDAYPPRPQEQVEVPIATVRAWMAGEPVGQISDLDWAPTQDARGRRPREPFDVLIRRPGEKRDIDERSPRRSDYALKRSAAEDSWCWSDDRPDRRIRPGDVLVVPAEVGGLDEFGWLPNSTVKVTDVAELSVFQSTSRGGGRAQPYLRIDDALAQRMCGADYDGRELARLRQHVMNDHDGQLSDHSGPVRSVVRQLINRRLEQEAAGTHHGDGWPMQAVEAVKGWLGDEVRGPALAVVQEPNARDYDRPVGLYLTGPLPAEDAGGQMPLTGVPSNATDDDPGSTSGSTRSVNLKDHHQNVGQRAAAIAHALELPDRLTSVLRQAAQWHDLGKLDRRFQLMLHGGDTVKADLALDPLAKSGTSPADSGAWRSARLKSKIPAGARHEAWSAALVETFLKGRAEWSEAEKALIVHLVASHHGHSRPWLPLIVDTDPQPVEATLQDFQETSETATVVRIPSERMVSLEYPNAFAQLNEELGRWGVAMLETIIRTADMTVSAEGS